MTSFLDLRPSSSPRSSLSSSSSPRPHTSSVTPTPHGRDDNELVTRQLPLMSSSITMPDSPSRPPRHHQRASTHSPKRLSVFGSRSRSNTATSTSSSFRSPASSMTSGSSSSHRSSQDSRAFASFVAPQEKQESRTRSLFVRGSRILRRQGSKFSISANLTLDEEDEMGRHSEKSREGDRRDGLGLFQRHRSRHSDTHEFTKHSISDPFNFQHVTHTNPGQLPPLEVTHPHDLATEFSILRASQRPKAELKGILAESIHYRDLPAEDSASILAPDSQSLFTRSPPTSPKAPTSPQSFYQDFSPRASRSVENFSRPVSRTRNHPPCPSITPPPRGSSRPTKASVIPQPTTQTVDALLGLHSPTTFPEYVPSRAETKSPRSPVAPLAAPFSYDVGHAYTTDDDSARPLRSPHVHTPDLADVPEEDESSPWRNSSVLKSPPPKFASTVGFGGTGGRPEFSKPLQNTASFLQVPKGSEALHSPTIPPKAEERPRSQVSRKEKKEQEKQRSIDTRGSVEDSWDDYIDYCYDHAAESNSNFDWQRSSFEEQRTTTDKFAMLGTDCSSPVEDKHQRFPSVTVALQPPSTSVSGKSTPDFSAVSAVSAVSSSTQPSTVSTAPTENSFEFFPAMGSPKSARSLETPAQIKVLAPPFDEHVSPVPYEDLIAGGDQDESQYAFYAHSDENYRSSRGSGSQISKCNSQESMILSRAASIARKHRSSVSTTSVPELIHSSSCSCNHDTVNRDSGSSDPPRALSPRVPSSASHWRSRTLTRDFSRPGSETSRQSTPNHDRTKSVPALESQGSLSSIQTVPQATNRTRSSTITRGGTRKARTSYSLFPSAAAKQQQAQGNQ